MKKLLLILIALPMIGFGQNVNIPDANFKSYLVANTAINTNGDNEIQVSEATAFSGGIYCGYMNISDLTGIEAFTALTWLTCGSNSLTNLDVSNNTALTNLNCQISQLTSLDVSQNTALTVLGCHENQLTSLDLSQNTALTYLQCGTNQLTSLDVRNGNNTLQSINTTNNPNLSCISVDDTSWSIANWTVSNGNIDAQQFFSNVCQGGFGCTDSLACNYDSSAIIENGNCVYQGNTPILECWETAIFDTPTCTWLVAGSQSTSTTTITVCDSYSWNSSTYLNSGSYNWVGTDSNGCDSVATLDLTINSSTSNITAITACGDYYIWAVDGNTYTTNGTYNVVSTNSAGCTHTETLTLSILPIPISNIYQNNSNLSVIPNSGLGPYTYMWSTMETTQSITTASFGTYWAFVTGVNECNSDTSFYNYSPTAINEIETTKQLLRIVNNLGQETPYKRNIQLFYIYDDGTVEKRIVIE